MTWDHAGNIDLAMKDLGGSKFGIPTWPWLTLSPNKVDRALEEFDFRLPIWLF
jgi:hypothetical protein